MTNKETILRSLKDNLGTYVSGEELSTRLGISRAAVSKHIGLLKKKGYGIESSPKKGYVLNSVPDLLLPEEIRDTLETECFGKQEMIYFPLTESTNDKAKELAAAGAVEGTVVVAEEQTAGRGRRGRSWFSRPGEGICISMILRPLMPPTEASRITLMTAVAIAEALLTLTDLDPRIKWPNDILVKGKKLAGILTEMSMEMDAVDYVVVGMGLNVNSPVEHFAEEVKTIATSVFAESGITMSRTCVVREYLKWFEHYYNIVKTEGFQPVMKRWKQLSDIVGKTVTVDIIGNRVTGKVDDIGEDGVLILKDRAGEYHRIISGDVLLSDSAFSV